jgi:ParB-like chromosome segregation protein Spo0J
VTDPKINPELRGLLVPLAKLKPDPKNAREHDERNLAAIEASLRDYGQQKPIVVSRDGFVIAGNGTYAAAKKIGWGKIAATRFDGTLAQARAFGIADNRTAELSSWNTDELAKQLKAMNRSDEHAVERLGFTDQEFARIMDRAESDPTATPEEKKAARKEEGKRKATPDSNVKAVPLLLNTKTYPQFVAWERKLRKAYGAKTITDTVREAVRRMAKLARSR